LKLWCSNFGTLIYYIPIIPEDMEEKKHPVPAMAVSAWSNPIKAKRSSEGADFASQSVYSYVHRLNAYVSFRIFQVRLCPITRRLTPPP